MSITKQRSTAGKSVLIFFIVFIILEALVVAGVSIVFRNKDVTPSLMGYSMYVMDSDKMGDHVPQGALVIAEEARPSLEGIKKAVIAENVPGIGTSVFWLANVSSSKDLTGVIYTVYQEKEPDKMYQLRSSNIVGIASSYYKTAGAVIRFLTSSFGRIALVAAPLFLLILLELIILIINRIRYADEYEDDDDEDEDDKTRNNVELDDFLFGGKNNKEMIESSVQSGAEVAEELKQGERGTRIKKAVASKSAPDLKFDKPAPRKSQKNNEVDADDFFGKPEKDSAKAVKEAKEEVKEDVKPIIGEDNSELKVDDTYLEKAAKFIDGEPEEQPAAAAEDKSEDISFSKKPNKDISSSFEDLMKLMEAESNKLKDQLGENKDGSDEN